MTLQAKLLEQIITKLMYKFDKTEIFYKKYLGFSFFQILLAKDILIRQDILYIGGYEKMKSKMKLFGHILVPMDLKLAINIVNQSILLLFRLLSGMM